MNILSKKNFLFYLNIAWLYTKYQLFAKSFLFFLIFPFFKWCMKFLIKSTGRVSITSGDYLSFLLSVQGLSLALLALALLTLLIGLDINAFIFISALIKEKKIKFSVRQLVSISLQSLKSLKFLLKPSGILIMFYTALIVPLLGISFTLSSTSTFKIPNFITDVILNNPAYTFIYHSLLIGLTILTFVFIFVFHYLLIDEQTIVNALKKSAALMKRHWKSFVSEFLIKFTFFVVLVSFLSFMLFTLALSYTENLDSVFWRRFITLFLTLTYHEILLYSGLMTLPLVCYKLTHLFYQFNEKDKYPISLKIHFEIKEDKRKQRPFTINILWIIFFVSVFIFNLLFALIHSWFFDEIFARRKNIEIVAHRGGGDLAAENSLLGMEKARALGATWSEIDVQRTKDGHYIIHHDTTFSRLAGLRKKSSDLTLEEIRALKLRDLFDEEREAQRFATLEEFLEASKGKIGLFIELKGKTADTKMADDVIRMVKEKGMEAEVAILSLDYKLISYVETHYPEMLTGYLYFFALGETQDLKSDLLIMEEREATPAKIDAIHAAGKKAFVWTVNTEESMKKFVKSNVDGIITDYVALIMEQVEESHQRDDMQRILDHILD